MTDNIAQWLGEQLDEDERIARAASAGPWTKHVGYISGGPDARVRVAQQAQGWNAEHIAKHDPARVLREIDAKRHVLRQLESAEASLRNTEFGTALHELMKGSVNSLRAAVNALALPYADRPGYREEWRP